MRLYRVDAVAIGHGCVGAELGRGKDLRAVVLEINPIFPPPIGFARYWDGTPCAL